MNKSGKYISYSIVIALFIVFFIASMCVYFAFGDRSMVSYILFGITGVTALIQVLAAVIYACRKDKDGLDELQSVPKYADRIFYANAVKRRKIS